MIKTNLMKHIKNLIGLLLGTLLLLSCDRTFEEINTDTSKIIEPTAGSMLIPIQYGLASNGYMRANDFTFDIMQIMIDFPNVGNTLSRYYMTENTGNGYWNTSYKWLKQIQEMNSLAVAQGDKNYEAISLVLNAWTYANLTDTFGDIPFSEASRIDEGISKPKFDKQKEIYIKLLDDLKKANSLFDAQTKLTEGDLYFAANTDANGILKWKKFTNSLSLRLLTRILKKNGEVNIYERIQEIIKDPATYPLMQNNTESAVMALSGVAPLVSPISRPQDFTTFRAAGEFFVNTLADNKDPRMATFLTQAKDLNNKNIGFKGAPAGYKQDMVFDYQPSNFNQNLSKAPMKIIMMPYAEVQMILAELSFKGIISGDTKTYYQNGIKASIEEWGGVVPADYFTNPKVAYNGTFEQIMLQKYVTLYFVDQQQWYEKRRTGFPKLPNNGGLLNDGKLPQRLMYPAQTKILNTENYNAAVQAMGADDINTLTWWNQ